MDTEKQAKASIINAQIAPASIQDTKDCETAERTLFAGRKTPQ